MIRAASRRAHSCFVPQLQANSLFIGDHLMPWTSYVLRFLRVLTGILLLPLLVTGCATVTKPPSATGAATSEEAASRPYHENIRINGRLSVSYQQYGRDEVIHGSFNWAQNADRTTITLFSPLGQTIAVIEVTPAFAILTQAGQAPRTAGNVDALVADALGWPLPVSGLRHWLQGFALDAEGNRFLVAAPSGSSKAMTHDGWRIQYPTWQEDAGTMRPKRIDMQRSGTKAGDVSIRLVIDNWQPA